MLYFPSALLVINCVNILQVSASFQKHNSDEYSEIEICATKLNSMYDPCGDAHPVTCGNKDRSSVLKPKICIKGVCRCKDGFVRDIHNQCILPENCPKCGDNEVFACGSSCDSTCATLGEACPIINMKCVDRCYCIDGYARNNNNTCVPIKQCPPKTCDLNQVYSHCPIYCPPEKTCEDYFNDTYYDCDNLPETIKCIPRCECKKGFIRKITNGECIKQSACCDDINAELVDCPNPCPGGTCEQPKHSPCGAQCPLRGCQCKRGYVKDENGMCIFLSQCPNVDDDNEE